MPFSHNHLFFAIALLVSGCDGANSYPERTPTASASNTDTQTANTQTITSANRTLRTENPEQWLADGQRELQNAIRLQHNTNTAKNIILFVGDGMGISTITAARILDGQLKGGSGEENTLSFESLPYLAHTKVYNTNQQIPDSAGTMTAMMSGIKTKAGLIGLNQKTIRGNCESSKGNEAVSFLTQAELNGLSTGIISTARITHATPAATYAHAPDRNWESWSHMPLQARNGGCKDIADQLIHFPAGDGIDVAMGGGRRNFLPNKSEYNSGEQANAIEGIRTDGRHLIQEWQSINPHGHYIIDQTAFDSIDTEQTNKVLALFNEHHMQYENERKTDTLGEPSLSEMTLKAINILNNNPKGFFLMVESGRIDQAHHAGSAHYALTETIEFSKAVQTAIDASNEADTLIIVAADHSNALSMAGYATRGNPILGTVVGNDAYGDPRVSPTLAADGYAFTTLTYANGLGFAEDAPGEERYYLAADNERHDLSNVDTQHIGYHQEALIPTGEVTHSGEDVAIFARGPWAHLFHKTHEQNYIYHVMLHASGIHKVD